MSKRLMSGTVAALLACFPAQSFACSYVEGATPPSQEQQDTWLKQSFDMADDLVDVVLLSSVTDLKPGKAKIKHSYKGRYRKGTIIKVSTTSGAMCGSGDAKAKQQLTLLLGKYKIHSIAQRLSPERVDSLAKWGLLKAKQ